jgi:hypothetical protein
MLSSSTSLYSLCRTSRCHHDLIIRYLSSTHARQITFDSDLRPKDIVGSNISVLRLVAKYARSLRRLIIPSLHDFWYELQAWVEPL